MGFNPPDEFVKVIRDHRFKSAYATRAVVFSALPSPNDADTAEELFALRNDALYAPPDNDVENADFEGDAAEAAWEDSANARAGEKAHPSAIDAFDP